jgi:hypothetical protein
MKKKTVPFTKANFIAWLRRQPDSREFKYFEGSRRDPVGCPLCNFFRESGIPFRYIGGRHYRPPTGPVIDFPKWVIAAVKDSTTGTAGNLKAALGVKP